MSEWPDLTGFATVKVGDKLVQDLAHTDLPFLSGTEWAALVSMPTIIGYTAVAHLLTLNELELRSSIQFYIASEQSRQFSALKTRESSLAALQAATTVAGRNAAQSPTRDLRGLKLNLSTYSGQEKQSLRRWFVEIRLGIDARRITDEPSKVAFALSHLAGPARAWGFNRLLADPNCFGTYKKFQEEITAEYEPPRTLHRAIAEFLELQQNKLSLHDYIQR